MKTLKLFILFLFVQFSGHAQLFDEDNRSKHVLQLETGIFDRGAFGFGYCFNLMFNKVPIFFSSNVSVGVGPNLGGANLYIATSEEINIGKNIVFTAGPDFKLGRMYYDIGSQWFDDRGSYHGIFYGGHIGFSFYFKNRFSFKYRLGYSESLEKVNYQAYYQFKPSYKKLRFPSIGVSFGFSLK